MQIATETGWQLFLDHSESPVLVCSTVSTTIVDINLHLLELLGYSERFLKKSLLTDFLLEGTPQDWHQQIDQFRSGITQEWETKVLSKKNEIKSVVLKIIEIDRAEETCLILIKELITETHKSSELKKKLSFYETILMQMPTEFAVLNSKWQYLFVNHNSIKDPEFREWMIGKTDYDFCRYRNKDYSIAENRHKQYNELARTKTGKEWIDEHITKDGKTKYVLRQLYPYFIDGALNMNFGFGIDITERINAEKEREKILGEITIQNEELKQFAYIISHDLKEPLRTISGFSNILQRKYGDKFDEKGVEYLQFVVDSANRMGDLLTGLKSFVTVDSNKIEKKIAEVDTQDLINDSIANLQLKLMETETEIDIPRPLPIVKGHSQYLSQLFQNLILNAIKFCETKPKIQITWEAQEAFIRFAFKDNGIGVDEKYQEKIFRIFNRLDKQNYEGTGMGLAICKKVVQLHNGTMWVKSDGQTGSTFYFTLKTNY